MKVNFFLLISAFILFRCGKTDLIEPQAQFEAAGLSITASIGTYYVSPTGSDSQDGSVSRPWRTLKYAASKVSSGYKILMAAGTYIENGLVAIPAGVHVIGAGVSQTFLKAASSFYYYPAVPGYGNDKFLISLSSTVQSNGNQQLSGFTIDGDAKRLHGGIMVRNRDNVSISDVKIVNTNFTGMWLWDVRDSKVHNTQIVNCSWGSSSYVAGALNIGNLTRVEISQLNVDENRGYGIKAMGPPGNNNLIKSTIHDSRISVTPTGLWQNGAAPNMAIEFWSCNLVGMEIYNTYVDNTISLVNNNLASTGVQTIRLHNNTIDLDARAAGKTYGIELTINDAEIDHNYFYKGTQGIANWQGSKKNWDIHHNTFYAQQSSYPGEAVRVQSSGMHNVKFNNNTVEFTSGKTMNVLGLYGGVSNNVDVKNNLLIDSNTGYSYYQNQLIRMENGAALSVLTVQNNLFQKLPVGNVPGTYSGNNTWALPKIMASGSRPGSYYMPQSSSPLINAGLNLGWTFLGGAPDIGAFEYSGTTTTSTTPPATGFTYLTLDSQSATLASKMTTGSDAGALNGNFFYVPAGNGKNGTIPPNSAATFTFSLAKAANYVIWAKVKTATSDNSRCSVYNGAGKWFIWNAGVHTSWTWVKITDAGTAAQFPFVIGGANQFKIGWQDDNFRVDQVIVTNDMAYIPS